MKTLIQKDICTPMFTAALFTIAKLWKQPKYPLMEEQIKKTWRVYTMKYYSAIKKNEFAICSNMDGPRDCHTQWSKSGRDSEVSYDTSYTQNLKKKKIQNNLFTKQKQTCRLREWTYGYGVGEGERKG